MAEAPAQAPGPAEAAPAAVTPEGRHDAEGARRRPPAAAAASARYTPPVPKELKVSPMWVPVLMFALLGLGDA